jgi:FkbM family methyltransferase
MNNLIHKLKFNPLTSRVRKTANRFGFEFSNYPNIGALLQDCDLAIDAGANIGASYDYFRGFGYRGSIISFEPTPETFRRLMQKPGYNWDRQNICLSDEEKELPFYIRGDIDGNQEWNGLGGMDGDTNRDKITVRTRRLDALLEKHPAKKIFLKTDCEGHDLVVVRGAHRILSRVGYLLMEVGTTPRHEGELCFAETIAALDALGFQVALFLGNYYLPVRKRSAAFDLIFERKANK